MLQRRYRLRSRTEIKLVFKEGKRWRHPLAVLVIRPNGENYSRFGFTASRGVGNAVMRNRAKRLLREVVRLNWSTLKPGFDCCLIARQSTSQATYLDVEQAVVTLLQRANLLNHESEAPRS